MTADEEQPFSDIEATLKKEPNRLGAYVGAAKAAECRRLALESNPNRFASSSPRKAMNSGGGSRRRTMALTDAKVCSCAAPAMPEQESP